MLLKPEKTVTLPPQEVFLSTVRCPMSAQNNFDEKMLFSGHRLGPNVLCRGGFMCEEYVRLLWGVCSTALGSMFNYLGEYVQLPLGVFSTTLGSMFNYPGEYVQLPSGVYSTTLGSLLNYPREYVQLP